MKRNKNKGFTLIELLVVVAIIGILASVGVVAYNGYTNSAQKSAAGSNYNSVAKWIQNEMQKCNVGEVTAMSGQLTCSGRTATTVATAVRASQRLTTSKMANPYDKTLADGTMNFAVQSDATALGACTTTNRGQIVVGNTANTAITIESCTAAAEDTVTNKLSESIAFN